MDVVWLDVRMWTSLRGHFHPFTAVECDPPEPTPADDVEWQRWAAQYLGIVAAQDGWQPGRYAYSAEQRDDHGRTRATLIRGHFEWAP